MSKKKLKAATPANCIIYTIIDFEGLTNFYNDTVPPKAAYDADSFNNIVCDAAPFVGPTNQILQLQPNINYTWQMQALANLSPEGKNGNLPNIQQFEFTYLSTKPSNKTYEELWNEIFDVANSNFNVNENKLISFDFDDAAAKITTVEKFSSDFKLSYSILFDFIINGLPVTGSIDPLIDNRNDDT